ncbi:MAG: carboxy terminal-processing peptidase [Lentisphaeria bacterium]|nr:carboxy terminal-processing peptidase [Lentisphaeria bacterium]
MIHGKSHSIRNLAAVLLLAGAALLPVRLGAAPDRQGKAGKAAPVLQATPEMGTIARSASYLLTRRHFLQRKLDGRVSAMLFDDYFTTLDPTHMFFMQQDVDEFAPVRTTLGSRLRRGDVQFAFDVFKRYLQRIGEYEKFTRKYLASKPSLNGNDTYEYNRKKAPWPKNRQELEKLWEKKARNDLIMQTMLDRSKQEKAAGSAKKATRKQPSRVKAPPEKTPEERLLYRISQFRKYYSDMDAMEVLELYLSTMAQVYDPHSQYLSPRTEEDFNINMKLSLVGIGALLSSEDGYTKIVRVIPGGPADLDGRLKPEDRIIAVTQENGEPVDTMDMPLTKVVSMIRGKEKTKVTLTILEAAKGSAAVPVNITLTRAQVELKDSEASGKVREIDTSAGKKRIVILTLPSFYIDFAAAMRGDENFRSSTGDISALIRKYAKEGPIDGMIIDLRSNPGGSLREAVTLTGLFIKEGPVVQVRDQRGRKTDEDQDGGKVEYDGPLAVLTNRFSASAAEIFAGAIKDYQRGIILGDSKTHGKGSVQTIMELERYTLFLGRQKSPGSLKLTNAKFYRINGESTQLKGITPDIVFNSFTDAMEIGEDQLPHALKWDTIRPVKYRIWDPALPRLIPELRKRSEERVAASPDFKLLHHDIEVFRKIRDRKTVVLNLDSRWEEYLAEKKMEDEQNKLIRLKTDEPEKEKNTVKDLYLDETLNVMRDWLDLELSRRRAAK